MPFTHLHVHSHYSFGQGASSPEALAEAAIRRGFSTLACTDTNGVWGAVDFQRVAESAGIRPILGAQLVWENEEAVVLAEDEAGWGRLCRVISHYHWAGAGGRADGQADSAIRPAGPPARLSALLTDRGGLFVLTTNIRLMEELTKASGTDRLYAELRPGKERHAVLAAARKLAVAPVATNAVMFANPEDWGRHRLIAAIGANTTLSACPPARLSA